MHCFFFSFVWYRLEGSTLQVMGPNVYKGEWSIVGGTGKLTMARGVIYKEELCVVDGMARIGLEIHAIYIPMERKDVRVSLLGYYYYLFFP